jgi:tRNA(Leu) C34 or U34 (ribose-2'-O)-methylase TrmL
MIVYLYKVGRNLNRCYRTCEFFGISNINLVDCNATLSGNLFKATNRVLVDTVRDLPEEEGTCYFETDGDIPVNEFDFKGIRNLCFGGESNNIPKNKNVYRIVIPKKGKVSGLTTEAALSIVLYEVWRQQIGT